MSDTTIRVIIADDHPLVLDGVRGVLETYDNLEVVGTAANGREALTLFDETKPDVVLMDLNMPEIGGLTATEIMREHNPEARILMLSMHNSPEYIATAKRHGARGYLLKDVPTQEIVDAIEAVFRGETYYCKGAQEALEPKYEQDHEPLTSREQTILLQLASGKSNKDVAQELDISARTVETHRSNIKRKLGISSTAGLTRYAIAHGVLQT